MVTDGCLKLKNESANERKMSGSTQSSTHVRVDSRHFLGSCLTQLSNMHRCHRCIHLAGRMLSLQSLLPLLLLTPASTRALRRGRGRRRNGPAGFLRGTSILLIE